ncbi:MAG: nitrile hydratase subunit alpha [Acetobacteraceae bacterium]|jgi:nitrile hydratase|nr:nitrile hydratase subunit alpha [Acetobacteraceae bacterium]
MPHDGHEHDHDHDHAHGHDHAPPPDDPSFASPQARGARALRLLLEEAGVLAPGEVARQIDRMDAITPSMGAAVVARAWVDPAFKARLIATPVAACAELGIDLQGTVLHVVENTAAVHNMIVCTLCSCYPKTLLGIPPDWYKSYAYRSRAVIEPRSVLAEFGVRIPDGIEVRVHDSTADLRYLVLPARPAGTEGWSEAQLAAIVTRDSMIGTAIPVA